MLHSEVGRTLKCIKFFLNQKSVLLSSAPSVAVFRLPQYVLCHPNCNVCWYKPFRAYDREKTFWITLPTTVSLVAGKQKVPPWESPLEGQVIKAQHLPKVPSSVQLLSHVRLFATPWTAARQASLSITDSQSLLKLMSVELAMPSNQLILCHHLLLPPLIFSFSLSQITSEPSIRN